MLFRNQYPGNVDARRHVKQQLRSNPLACGTLVTGKIRSVHYTCVICGAQCAWFLLGNCPKKSQTRHALCILRCEPSVHLKLASPCAKYPWHSGSRVCHVWQVLPLQASSACLNILSSDKAPQECSCRHPAQLPSKPCWSWQHSNSFQDFQVVFFGPKKQRSGGSGKERLPSRISK